MTSTFKKFAKLALATFALTMAQNTHVLSAVKLEESDGNAARATLKLIDKHISFAVGEADTLYRNSTTNGMPYNPVSSSIAKSLIVNATDALYLQELSVTNSRNIQIQYVDSGTDAGFRTDAGTQVQLFKGLFSKRILLVPVVAVGDISIGAWECLTDADSGVKGFVGQVETSSGTRSLIADYSDNEYLGNCKYITPALMDAEWKP